MTSADQFAPRNDPQGRYTRTCPGCGEEFRTDNPRKKHCSYKCYRKAGNHRYYKKNDKKIIEQVITRRNSAGGQE